MNRKPSLFRRAALALTLMTALVASAALGQYRFGGVTIADPLMQVQNAVIALASRIATLESALKSEIQARQALEKEVATLKKAAAEKSGQRPTRSGNGG